MLVIGIHRCKGQPIVMVLSMNRILTEIIQRTVHPPPPPLHSVAKSIVIRRFAHPRPRRRFLRYGLYIGIIGIYSFIKFLKECHSFQVLPATKLIGYPLTFI